MYSGLNPNVVRSPEQTTRFGSRSFTSEIARSIRFGTKYGPPQWRSEMWAMVKRSATAMAGKSRVSGPLGILTALKSDVPDFQAYRGSEPPQFANQAELECAKILDYHGVPW